MGNKRRERRRREREDDDQTKAAVRGCCSLADSSGGASRYSLAMQYRTMLVVSPLPSLHIFFFFFLCKFQS